MDAEIPSSRKFIFLYISTLSCRQVRMSCFLPFFCSRRLYSSISARQTTDSDLAVVLDQVDLIAFLEAKLPNKLGGQADGKRVAPFRDLHFGLLRGYTISNVYQTSYMGKPVRELGLLLCVTQWLTPDLESACANLIGQAIVSKNNARSHKNRAHGSSGA